MSTTIDGDAYVGFKSCGCHVYVVSADAEYAKEAAKAVAEMITDGLRVEIRKDSWVRANRFGCNCEPQQRDLFQGAAT